MSLFQFDLQNQAWRFKLPSQAENHFWAVSDMIKPGLGSKAALGVGGCVRGWLEREGNRKGR